MTADLHFILTGGTIDGFYNAINQTATPNLNSVIPEYLNESIHPYTEITYNQICMKDSKDITEDDRAKILKDIEQNPASRIIITHGTDTMEVTAEYILNALELPQKTIILTGAMIPLKGFSNSDPPLIWATQWPAPACCAPESISPCMEEFLQPDTSQKTKTAPASNLRNSTLFAQKNIKAYK
jgi:L-asparaginase